MALQHRNAATYSEKFASLEKGGEKKKKEEHVSREIKSPVNVGGDQYRIQYQNQVHNTVQNQIDSTVQDEVADHQMVEEIEYNIVKYTVQQTTTERR